MARPLYTTKIPIYFSSYITPIPLFQNMFVTFYYFSIHILFSSRRNTSKYALKTRQIQRLLFFHRRKNSIQVISSSNWCPFLRFKILWVNCYSYGYQIISMPLQKKAWVILLSMILFQKQLPENIRQSTQIYKFMLMLSNLYCFL